jgi:hypothetical protein
MYPAIILFLTNFLKTLFIILIIWYGIKLVTKYVLPRLLNKTMKNVQSRMEGQFRQQERSARTEGEVTIEHNPKNGTSKFNEGEYVDFEEVE